MKESKPQISAQHQLDMLLTEHGPNFIHPPCSPYLNLSIAEQALLSKMRRGDGRTPKWRTSAMRKATKKDYEKLLIACNEALINAWYDPTIRLDRVVIYVRLPFNWRMYYDKNLPRAVILGYDDWTMTISWNVDKIINWLYDKGYSKYTASELRKSIWAVLLEQEKLDLYYDVATETSILELYSEIIQDVKEKKITRNDKGKGALSRNAKLNVDNSLNV